MNIILVNGYFGSEVFIEFPDKQPFNLVLKQQWNQNSSQQHHAKGDSHRNEAHAHDFPPFWLRLGVEVGYNFFHVQSYNDYLNAADEKNI